MVRKFRIHDGPGRFDAMLSLFNGERVRIQVETEHVTIIFTCITNAEKANTERTRDTLPLEAIEFQARVILGNHQIFSNAFCTGTYSLRTRKGTLNVADC